MAKKKINKNKSLSSFYAQFYFKIAAILKWPLLIFLLLILFSSIVILISEQFTDYKYHFYALETDSMEPTLLVGDMIIVEKDEEGYQVNDIVTFKYKEDNKKPITHRIIEIDDTTTPPITTKGDNNPTPDGIRLNESQIVGKVTKNIRNLGNIVLFMRSVEGIIILYIIPVTILLTLNAQSIYTWLEKKAKE